MEFFFLVFAVLVGLVLRLTGLNEIINEAGLAGVATYGLVALFGIGIWLLIWRGTKEL